MSDRLSTSGMSHADDATLASDSVPVYLPSGLVSGISVPGNGSRMTGSARKSVTTLGFILS